MESKDKRLNHFNSESEENLGEGKNGDWSSSGYKESSGNIMTGSGRIEGMEEVHLGKGLIKPTKVQMQVDGYHFSYERPPHRFSKLEPESVAKHELNTLKSKPFEAKMPLEAEITSGIEREEREVKASEVFKEIEQVIETDHATEAENVQNDVADDEPSKEEVGDKTVPLRTDESNENNQEEKLSEPFSAPLPEISESLAKDVASDIQSLKKEQGKSLLAGSQTWYGIPLPNAYQITTETLTLFDPDNGLRQIELEDINGVWIHQSFLMKLLGIGNVGIELKNSPGEPVILKGLTKPKQVLKILKNLTTRTLDDCIS